MNQYIQERYNRKKMRSRISLGVQILIQKPVINLLWVVLVACVLAVVYGEGKFISIYESESFLREVMDVVLRIVNVVVTIAFILAIIESGAASRQHRHLKRKNSILFLVFLDFPHFFIHSGWQDTLF